MKQFFASAAGVMGVIALGSLQPVSLAGRAQTTAGKAKTTAPAETGTPPRTPWGDPDLQGTWNSNDDAITPFERPTKFGEKQVLTGDELAALLEERAQRLA